MHAEITITTPDGLPSNLQRQVEAWFTPCIASREALAVAGLHPALLPQMLAATISGSAVVTVLRHDAGTLRVHVRLTEGDGSPPLRYAAEEWAGSTKRFLVAHGRRAGPVVIRVFAEGHHLETGRKLSWLDRLLDSARREIAGRLSVPVSTFLVSFVLDSELRKAAISAGAAFVGVVVWLLVSTTLDRRGYRYE